MYEWRKLNNSERINLLDDRKRRNFPLHNTPHYSGNTNLYHISSACYEHKSILGADNKRLENFTDHLIRFCQKNGGLHAWVVLPNHYHLLIEVDDLKVFIKEHGKFHGRLSYQFNKEDKTQGRQCFHGQSDRYIRSWRHYWVTMNYIHNNPVHHKYVNKWLAWPHSSAAQFLRIYGYEKAKEIWHEYPLKEYGKNWDDF